MSKREKPSESLQNTMKPKHNEWGNTASACYSTNAQCANFLLQFHEYRFIETTKHCCIKTEIGREGDCAIQSIKCYIPLHIDAIYTSVKCATQSLHLWCTHSFTTFILQRSHVCLSACMFALSFNCCCRFCCFSHSLLWCITTIVSYELSAFTPSTWI